MANSTNLDQMGTQKRTGLDLVCLQRQSIYGLRTRVNYHHSDTVFLLLYRFVDRNLSVSIMPDNISF